MRWKDWDRNLKIRLLGEAMMNLLFWAYFPFMTIFFQDAFGKDKAGWLLMLSQALSVLASLVGGYCADRFGRRRMMSIAVAGQSITFLVFAYANSPWLTSSALTFLAFSFLGIWSALYWPASHAMVADVVKEKDRASVFAVFYTSLNIAVVIGPLIGTVLFYSYRFQMLLAGFLLTAILFVIMQVFIRETVPEKKQEKADHAAWYKAVWKELQTYRIIAKDRTFLLFIVAGVLVAQTFMQLDILIAVYTSEVITNQTVFALGDLRIEVDGKQAFSLILALNGLLVAIFTVFTSKFVTKFRIARVFVASSIAYAAGILLYGMTESFWIFVVAIILFTIGELMVVGLQESFVATLATEESRGQYFSAASLRFTLGKLLAPLSLVLVSYMSYQLTFTILALLALVSAFVYNAMFKRYHKEQRVAS
ncbi:Predicted arabinose efflux permease, MFS family [Terribacillus saccharophilus]|uniref:Predicted arabinose efflux permease, MFS family n=1 Tax=Terribacillus saccharophilus TaxID=361277 RepID=A0AAX2EE37_9BACI|nr:Predicted arabinose efflux permease, MFS family [Terribacillus saccharophilus]